MLLPVRQLDNEKILATYFSVFCNQSKNGGEPVTYHNVLENVTRFFVTHLYFFV